MNRKHKSPIKRNTLRQAGESIRNEQYDLIVDKLLPLYTLVVLVWLMTFLEWVWSLNNTRPSPLAMTVLAGGLTVYGIWRAWPSWRYLMNLKLGYEGERAVGEYLDRLRRLGYRIYHDIPGDSGNIDHVIICTRGVYCIETKTRSKPIKGECKIRYDGSAVSLNNGPPDQSPIIQAKAQARQLQRLLKEHTGSDFPIQPVVLFPGWHIDANSKSDVWVLTPKGLPMWIGSEEERIPMKDVKHAASQLAAYVRDYR
jgi:hypothetical protein